MDAIKRSLGIGTAQSSDGTRTAADESNVARVSRRERDAIQRSDCPIAAANRAPNTIATQTTSETIAVRSKLTSMWHSVKYGKAAFAAVSAASNDQNFDRNSAVWLLGQCYLKRRRRSSEQSNADDDKEDDAIKEFALDFASKIWMTYRRDMEELSPGGLRSDCGWGCMIRSGQMLVANALTLQRLGRQWRWRRSGHTSQRRGRRVNNEEDCVEVTTMTALEMQEEMEHRRILRLFGDSRRCPLSLHNLCDAAAANPVGGKVPGDWFGPSSTAHMLKDAAARAAASGDPVLSQVCIYVAQDCTVYKQDVRDLCEKRAEQNRRLRNKESSPAVAAEDFSFLETPSASDYDPSAMVPTEAVDQQSGARLTSGVVHGVPYFDDDAAEFVEEAEECAPYSLNQQVEIDGEVWVAEGPATPAPPVGRIYPDLETSDPEWTPVLLMIPVRLGGERLNPLYTPCLRALLASDSCVGIVGGRPRHSLYFVGFQDDNLIHLDPHLVQESVNVDSPEFSEESYHCRSPRKMCFDRMDPSCCLGFFCATRNAFEGWCEVVRELAVPPSSSCDYPMFGIAEGRAREHQGLRRISVMEEEEEDNVPEHVARNNPVAPLSEEFVFL